MVVKRSFSFGPSPKLRLLRPLLTSRSGLHRRPFRHKTRSPQVRTQSFPAQPPDLRRLILDHKSFAVCCPLALIDGASYPILVHRLAVSIHASSPQSVALPQLRFTSFAVVSLREDFHLQDRAHAGRTTTKPAKCGLCHRFGYGGGGNRTRVRKHSTDSSTYLALPFNLICTARTRTLRTDELPII